MRTANFQVENSIYLQQDGRDFDLHNDYDFSAFSYSVAERVVELSWSRSPGDWVRRDMPAQLVLSCHGVTHLSATGRDPQMPFTEDDCLSDVADGDFQRGFLASSAAEAFDSSWHWLFSFMSGFTMRIAGETAHLSIQQT